MFLYISDFGISSKKANEYTDTEKEAIYSKYINNENMLNALFSNDTSVGYWNMINRIKENDFLKKSIDTASKIIGEYPDKQDYAEILANLIMMQGGNIAEQVQTQSQYDDLKDGIDYTMDIISIATDFAGDTGLLENIESIINTATDGAEILIDISNKRNIMKQALKTMHSQIYSLKLYQNMLKTRNYVALPLH